MRAYRTVNLVILCLLLYALVFSLISPFMEELLPDLWQCQYRAITGRPCPFCGLTGDMRNYLLTGSGTNYANPSFPELVKLYFGILFLRTVFTAASFPCRNRYLPWADGAVHLVFLSIFFLG